MRMYIPSVCYDSIKAFLLYISKYKRSFIYFRIYTLSILYYTDFLFMFCYYEYKYRKIKI